MAVYDARPAAPVAPLIADPGPLGLGGFALTTFILSGHNAGFIPDLTWLGLAIFYGGLAQFLAGMWEFRRGNTFAATAFSTYGAFWFSLATFVLLILFDKVDPKAINIDNALGWFLIAFAIFNTYMLIWAARVNVAVFAVFLTLEITEIVDAFGFFGGNAAGSGLLQVGGYIGIITAIAAWYASAAGVANSLSATPILAVGRPLVGAPAAPAATERPTSTLPRR